MKPKRSAFEHRPSVIMPPFDQDIHIPGCSHPCYFIRMRETRCRRCQDEEEGGTGCDMETGTPRREFTFSRIRSVSGPVKNGLMDKIGYPRRARNRNPHRSVSGIIAEAERDTVTVASRGYAAKGPCRPFRTRFTIAGLIIFTRGNSATESRDKTRQY